MSQTVHGRGAEAQRQRRLVAEDLAADVDILDVDEDARADLVAVVCIFVVLEAAECERALSAKENTAEPGRLQ